LDTSRPEDGVLLDPNGDTSIKVNGSNKEVDGDHSRKTENGSVKDLNTDTGTDKLVDGYAK
jgi:hypothetical protein